MKKPRDHPGHWSGRRIFSDFRLNALLPTLLMLDLFVVGMSGFVLWRGHGQERDKTILIADNLSRELDENLSRMIDKIDLTLLAVADEAERQQSTGGIKRPLFESVLARHDRRLPEAVGLRVVDAKGTIQYAVSHVETSNNDVADREYFTRQRDDPNTGLFISTPFVGRLSLQPMIIFSRRYSAADGSFAGIVNEAVAVNSLTTILSGIDVGAHGNASLWDGRLGLVARYSPIPIPNVNTATSSPTLTDLIRNSADPTAFHTKSGVDGVERTFFFRKVSRWPLYLTVGLADDDFMVGWWREVTYLSCLTSLFILGSAAAFAAFRRTMGVLQRSEQLLREVQAAANLGYYVYDLPSDRWLSSEILDRIFGIGDAYPRDAHHWLELVAAESREEMRDHLNTVLARSVPFDREYRIVRPNDGQERWVHGTGKLQLDAQGKPLALVGTIQDITERKESESQINELAFYDPLTRLPNRRLLADRLKQAMAASLRHELEGAVLFIDLDHFKTVNDTLGHNKGDLLLQEVARRLTACFRDADTVARIGGDEFVVVLANLSDDSEDAAGQARVVGEKVLAILGEPYRILGNEFRCTPSVGIALFGDQSGGLDELMKQADIAMYQAKAAGRHALRFFDPDLQTAIKARAEMEDDLRQGIEAGQLLLYYQPQVDDRGAWTGAEALVRWRHPLRGLVSPGEFIGLAEDTGLVLPLGNWVLKTACLQTVAWAKKPEMAHLTLAVNVSARQFHQADFVASVLAMVERTGADPRRLKLELTESTLLDNVQDIIDKMETLKARGFTFSLDDFGTGYSSLAYLKRLPLDQLKIDQSFVRDVLVDSNDAAIAETIVALAQSLKLNVIAEGVETRAQKDFLAAIGCHAYQGYFFGHPMPLEDFELSAAALIPS